MYNILLLLAFLCGIALADFSIGEMLFHLMFLVIFLGSFGFMAASVTKSGNSTAVLMVLLILFFWLASGVLEGSSWNLFHNPFMVGNESSMMFWSEVTLYNRVYLLVGAILSTMFGLLRLQQRERFF